MVKSRLFADKRRPHRAKTQLSTRRQERLQGKLRDNEARKYWNGVVGETDRDQWRHPPEGRWCNLISFIEVFRGALTHLYAPRVLM